MRLLKLLAIILLPVIFSLSTVAQSAPSPEEFLGYPLGSRYTPHHTVVQYAEAVAKANPATMKFSEYGRTYEQRPLVTVTIASPENMARLEAIRLNNLRLAGMARDKMAPSEDMPVIVWMSYNVHGSEPASSEAAMKTIYELSRRASSSSLSKSGLSKSPGLLESPLLESEDWFKKVVVIIDPCINPDGRDRYVNWYNSVRAATPDPEPQSREHQEPWPGGRTNHYNFDLNRDWAWQSQVESQQRLALYNAWLPQVHVDFHEQGYNSPYYFAPAAEPYHDVITPWQREFQVMIGRNNAKYFDANGWLYFTKERFDLFYPSYGDTYPTYSGGIGMTFEQGGIGGGLAVIQNSGDTLTLKDRLEHHFTTGMSTVEVSSQNAVRLVREFRRFFADAMQNGSGPYKTFIIRLDASKPMLRVRLEKFLGDNGISHGYAADSKPYKVYNYVSGREETRSFSPSDMVIQTQQPKGALARVLFEPKSRISDSATYDVTAWAIPYAWGLEAWASPTKVDVEREKGLADAALTSSPNAIGYVIPWNDLASVQALSALMKKGIKVRVADDPFEIGKTKFERGSLIVLRTSNTALGDQLYPALSQTLREAKVEAVNLTPITTAFVDKGSDLGSSSVRFIRKPKVALFTGQGTSAYGAGQVWHFFEQDLRYPLSLVNAESASAMRWSEFDVVIMPEGSYRFLQDKSGQDAFRNWIRQGGRVIALESAVTQLANMDMGPKLKKEEEGKEKMEDSLRRYENRERDALRSSIPGSVYKMELDNSHPLAFGMPGHYFTLKMDDNIYEYLKDGWNVGTLKKDGFVSGFAGVKTKARLKDGLLIGQVPMGRGSVIFFTDDPLFRSFWNSGKMLLANAVFMAQ
jgi:hypothetical protein